MFSPKIGPSYNFWNFWECSQVFLKDNSRNSCVLESRRIIKFLCLVLQGKRASATLRTRRFTPCWRRTGLRLTRRNISSCCPWEPVWLSCQERSPGLQWTPGKALGQTIHQQVCLPRTLQRLCCNISSKFRLKHFFPSRDANITVKFYLSHWDPGKATALARPSSTFTLFCSILETFQFF